MNKLLFSAAMLCLILTNDCRLMAQSLFYGCSSAGRPGQTVTFHCDTPDTLATTVILRHKGQSDTGFNQVFMTPLAEFPYYRFTYNADIHFAGNPVVLEYFFSTRRDTIMITQSPKNAGDQFPPASYRYADFITDPQGDMTGGSAGNWLDLTGNGMTYSDTRIYCYLQNVSGTWPLNQLFNYFVYTFGFLITAGPESSYYALVYANVPLLLSSGLYVLNLSDSSYNRIGDISYNISGGTLHLACYISQFSADPGWPGWPPPDGYIIPMGATLTASLSGQTINDFTYTPIYEPKTQFLDFSTNTAPQLPSYRLEIDSAASITARVRYIDQDNNLPRIRRLRFDSDSFVMSSYDHIYSDSSEFEAILPWPGGGWHRYYFEFCDGRDTVLTPADSILIPAGECDYILGDINGDGVCIGGDVTFGVRYFKGLGIQPPDSCYSDSLSGYLYVAGDCNGDCQFRGSDITRLVQYFKGNAGLSYCRFFPPPHLRESHIGGSRIYR